MTRLIQLDVDYAFTKQRCRTECITADSDRRGNDINWFWRTN